MSYLALCPLEKELKAILNHFRSEGYEITENRAGSRPTYSVEPLSLILAVGGHGKVQFALTSQQLIHEMRSLKGLLCLGAAGGLSPQTKVFDLVIGQVSLEHDYYQKFGRTQPRPQFKSHISLINMATRGKKVAIKDGHLHSGIIASGDEDIVSPERAQELFDSTGALAVAWEGAGGARAAQANNIPYLEIRAITDDARHEVHADFYANLPKAMNHLAVLLENMLQT